MKPQLLLAPLLVLVPSGLLDLLLLFLQGLADRVQVGALALAHESLSWSSSLSRSSSPSCDWSDSSITANPAPAGSLRIPIFPAGVSDSGLFTSPPSSRAFSTASSKGSTTKEG